MSLRGKLSSLKYKLSNSSKKRIKKYYNRYKKYAFTETKCKDLRQIEASITKLYHAIEKGLAYEDFRPGFGKNNINALILSLEQYSALYDTSVFFYKTALCVLKEYLKKNKKFGYEDEQLEKRILSLAGEANDCGGIIEFVPYKNEATVFDYGEFVKSRHSIRHFDKEPADNKKIVEAIELAQNTPSACNRQGWSTRIITEPLKLKKILDNQNGNRGFGQEITSLLIVTGDMRCFNRGRELHQVFIDGGMYAMSVLNALHYKELATIPLSASLREDQERNVRQLANLEEFEELILFIGVGNYPQHCITTRSERRPCVVKKD